MKRNNNLIYSSMVTMLMMISTSAFADGGWTAIVFNPQTGSWGSHHGDSARVDAEANAMNECGNDCAGVSASDLENHNSSLIETFALNGWIALAVDGQGHFGTGGLHDTQENAEKSAMQNCQRSGASCHVVRSLASYSEYADEDGTNILVPSSN